MADKKLKLKAEAKTAPKPKPTLPKPGMGPRIDVPPTGPKISVPSDLQKQVLDYKPKASASGVRGATAEAMKAKAVRGVSSEALAARKMLPTSATATKAPIRLPATLPKSVPAKAMTVDTTATKVTKGTISRTELATKGVQEKIRPGAGMQPKPLQLPAPPKSTAPVVETAAKAVVKPAAETKSSVLKKLGDVSKKAGKALVQDQNPYRQATRTAATKALGKVGIKLGPKEALSTLGKIKKVGAAAGKTVKFGRLAGRAVARVAFPLAVAEAAYSGGKTLLEVGGEHNRALSSLAASDNAASKVMKKTGTKITRPALTLRDKIAMTVIPGYDAPASDMNEMKVYDSSGKQISGPRKKRR